MAKDKGYGVFKLYERTDADLGRSPLEKVVVVEVPYVEDMILRELKEGVIAFGDPNHVFKSLGKTGFREFYLDHGVSYTDYNFERLGVISSEKIPDFEGYCKQQWDAYPLSVIGRVAQVRSLLDQLQGDTSKVLVLQEGLDKAHVTSGDLVERSVANLWMRRWLSSDVSEYSRRLNGWKRIIDEVVLKDVSPEKLQAPTLGGLAVKYLSKEVR
ncbi:MAG: hypothetical protein WCV90_06215 [Candidatus Woesearchaeota archaeon]